MKPKDRQPGAMARWAMRHAAWYHCTSLAMACCITPVGLVIQTIVLIDLARTPRYHRGRKVALIASIIYLLVTTAALVFNLFSLLPFIGEPTTDPSTSSDTSRSP